MNIKFPATRWSGNTLQNREKHKQTKKRQLDTLVVSGKRKCRKKKVELYFGVYIIHIV